MINRNINFTNVCYVGCSFCGFSRHADDADAYDRTMEEILAKCRDHIDEAAPVVDDPVSERKLRHSLLKFDIRVVVKRSGRITAG